MTVNYETGEIVEPLTAMERSELVHQEAAIEQGADQVAKALGAIRDQRLYRETYATFEEYCRERWGMTRQHANRQIVAAEVAEILEPIGSKVPESQARELADLRDEPEQMREVYQEASDATDGNVTAAAIREVRNPTPAPPAPTVEEAIREFPDLAHYADDHARVINMAADLRRYRERGELDERLANLRRSIELDKSKRDGTYTPTPMPKVCHACGQTVRS